MRLSNLIGRLDGKSDWDTIGKPEVGWENTKELWRKIVTDKGSYNQTHYEEIALISSEGLLKYNRFAPQAPGTEVRVSAQPVVKEKRIKKKLETVSTQ